MIDFYSYKNIVFQARVYEFHEAFDDAPVEGQFDWGKLALNVLGGVAIAGIVALGFVGIGLVAGVAVLGLVFAFTGTFSMATVYTLMIFLL